jgi:DNA-binding transcriptional ArsR family regulator
MSDRHALFFKALSSRSRTKILQILANRGELSVDELTQSLDLAGPTVSRHLQILRLQEIVSVRRDAQNRYYSVNRERLAQKFNTFLAELRSDVPLAPAKSDSSTDRS